MRLKTAELLAGYGLDALIVDSNGRGGYHVRSFLKTPVTAEVGFWLGERVNAALAAEGYPAIEWFPKQPDLTLDRLYGNWTRIPAKHHKRDHWSRTRPEDRPLARRRGRGPRLIAVAGDDPGRS